MKEGVIGYLIIIVVQVEGIVSLPKLYAGPGTMTGKRSVVFFGYYILVPNSEIYLSDMAPG